MKKFILLDWDGNLAQTLYVWLEACRVPLVNRDIHLSDKEIATCFGRIVERWTDWGVTDIKVAFDEMDAYARKNLPEVELYPDALYVMEELRKKDKKTALITSSFHYLVEGVLEKYNMTELFDVLVTGSDVTHHKPHPEPLELAMKKLGATPEESIMIGDTDNDIEAAKNVGVESILFYPPEHRAFYDLEKLKSLQPTHIVEDFRNVLNLV